MPRSARIGDEGIGLGARVANARRTLNLTQGALAAEVGVTPASIYMIEDGRTKVPGVFLMLRIAEALGVSIDYLVFGVGDKNAPKPRRRPQRPQDQYDTELGKRVQQLRQEHDFTVAALAKACGYSEDVIRAI